MIDPSLPDVNRYFPVSVATADVTENRCPRVRSVFEGGPEKSN